MKRNNKIGDILVEQNIISKAQLNKVLSQQRLMPGKKVGQLLIEAGYVDEKQLALALSERLKIQFRDLSEIKVSQEVINTIDEKLARKYAMVPIEKNEQLLTVAMSDPMNLQALEEVHMVTKMVVLSVISPSTQIEKIIEESYSRQRAMDAAQQLEKAFESDKEKAVIDTRQIEEIENAPVVKMVNSIVAQAVKVGASDIHVEPNKQFTKIRMRIDGRLQEQVKLRATTHEAIVTRLKVIADMNIAEKRTPQDGRCEFRIEGKKVDVRLASIPTVNGEKVVMRILNIENQAIIGIDSLGLSQSNYEKFQELIKNPHGIVLVTGPTGSGKSTTLYAVLKELNKVEDNIITLEDPVEKKIEGINQVQINTKANLTFANGLRSILRQDPDVIMVGEIRDEETVEIAIRAAITGHLVFSTLHTNNAVAAITRLIDMGVQPYLLASALVGVVAQRLVRSVCKECKESYIASAEEMKMLGTDKPQVLYKGKGCQACNFTGYKGRKAIHEVIVISGKLRQLITEGASLQQIWQRCREEGVQSLDDNMKQLVLRGESTTEEWLRVTYHVE